MLFRGSAAFDEVVPGWFLLAAAWGSGYALRGRQLQASALADRADRLERERVAQARAAVAPPNVAAWRASSTTWWRTA